MRVLPLLLAAALAAPLATPVAAGPKGCPPGLAKKSERCIPPGHARRGHDDDDDDDEHHHDHDGWYEGRRIPYDRPWYEVRDWDRYDLPRPPDGSRYVLIDNDLVRVAIATGVILEYLGRY